MASKKVCTIILNWNNWRHTTECLDSLVAATICPDTIIVCDNGSIDESLDRICDWIKERGKRVFQIADDKSIAFDFNGYKSSFVLIKNTINLGYSGGNNQGISYALAAQQFDFIWILNNDTLVAQDCLEKLVLCAKESEAGIIGSTIVYSSNPEKVQCAGGCRYSPITSIFHHVMGGKPLARVLEIQSQPEIDYIYGASLFIRTEVFEKCGLLNEEFFLFYEEMDFCRRARASGYRLFWCQESIVQHKVSQSVGSPECDDKEKKIKANYHENLSTLLYTKLHHKNILFFVMVFRFFGKLAKIAVRREWYLAKPLISAYQDFMDKRSEDSSPA